MDAKNLQIFFLSSTHWDREWYQPFQAMRFQLIETVDELIDTLEERPEFQLFCMDGQTIVLEDYVVGAPENADRLRALIQAGRVRIGPWYAMPDERLVSGESIIHNFLRGRRVAAEWGVETWKFGYLCDIFGHIAQMPQILRGFGIGGAYLSRGIGNADWRGPFRWQSPDGSEVIGCLGCYADFTRRVTALYGTPGYPKALKDEVNGLLEDGTVPVIVLADADDHARVNLHTPEILADLRKLYPNARIYHESLEKLPEAAKPFYEQLPLKQGELTQTTRDRQRKLRVVTNSISSYYPLKARNDHCQSLLEKVAGPLYAAACLAGMKPRTALWNLCWKYLLQNQPHDSICGCSTDQVHMDMPYRFDQAEGIAGELIRRADAWLYPAGQDGLCLQIVNPFPYEWNAPLRLEAALPHDFSTRFAEPAGYTPRNSFRLFDGRGKEIPYHLHGIRRDVTRRLTGQQSDTVDLYDLSLLPTLSAMGATRLEIRPDPRPVRFDDGGMTYGPDWCDNGRVAVRLLPDGTFTLTDHATGRVYTGLNRFADNGEDGNGWFHDAPIGDITRIAGAPASFCRSAAGPVRVTFRVCQRLPLPAGREDTREVALTLATEITLWKDQRAVEVDVTLENTAADHRLQALFPSGVTTGAYMAGQAFTCVERTAGADPNTLNWDEPDPLEKDMDGLLYARDAEGGLAFVSPAGLHEGGMTRDGVLTVTMLRSFSRAYLADRPQSSKLLETHRFHWALVPLDASVSHAQLLRMRDQMAVTLPFGVQAGQAGNDEPLLAMEGDSLIFSTLKAPEDGARDAVILRVWNSTNEEARGEVRTDFAMASAAQLTLDETACEPLACDGQRVDLRLRPHEICTIRMQRKDSSNDISIGK